MMLAFNSVISTESPDLAGDVLLADGCILADFSNELRTEHKHVVGVVHSVRQHGSRLYAKGMVFPSRIGEHVRKAHDALQHVMQHGSELGLSVGIDIIKHRPATDQDRHKYGRTCKRVITAWKLLEVSLTDRPCNTSARVTKVYKALHTKRFRRLEQRQIVRDVVSDLQQQGLFDSAPALSR